MGDRANIYLEMPRAWGPDAEKGGVYLYTHSGGYHWPEALREALDFGHKRWDDDIYLARIITSRVFRDIADQQTGGGLSLMRGDNENPIIVVDLTKMTVSFAPEGREADPAARYGEMTFAEYVAQDRADYPDRD